MLGFGPVAEVLLFRQKDPKPMTPRPASLDGWTQDLGRRTKLAELVLSLLEGLTQGPPAHESVNPEGLAAGVGQIEKEGEGENFRRRK